jgi:hypothetical protein
VGEIRAKPAPPPIGVLPHIDTALDLATVRRIFTAIDTVPEGFTVHPKLAKQFDTRRAAFADGTGDVDWGLAEALALGSLLEDGTNVRLAGQDTRRGTFSHRHSVLVDYETGREYMPWPTWVSGRASGSSTTRCSRIRRPRLRVRLLRGGQGRLVCWEAQFGDFVNGAMIIIDQFLVSAGDKWDRRRAWSCSCLRLRGPGPGALLGPHRTVPDAVRRGQHAGRLSVDRRAVLPPPAAADGATGAQAAHRLHAQVTAPGRRPGPPWPTWSRARSRRSWTTRG